MRNLGLIEATKAPNYLILINQRCVLYFQLQVSDSLFHRRGLPEVCLEYDGQSSHLTTHVVSVSLSSQKSLSLNPLCQQIQDAE